MKSLYKQTWYGIKANGIKQYNLYPMTWDEVSTFLKKTPNYYEAFVIEEPLTKFAPRP